MFPSYTESPVILVVQTFKDAATNDSLGREPALQSTLDGRPFGVIVLREWLTGHVIHKVSFLITAIIRNGTFRVQVGSAHLH